MLKVGTMLRHILTGEIYTVFNIMPERKYIYALEGVDNGITCVVDRQLKICSHIDTPSFEITEKEQKIVLRWKDIGDGYYTTSYKNLKFMLVTERIGSKDPEYILLCEDGAQHKIGSQLLFMELIHSL